MEPNASTTDELNSSIIIWLFSKEKNTLLIKISVIKLASVC